MRTKLWHGVTRIVVRESPLRFVEGRAVRAMTISARNEEREMVVRVLRLVLRQRKRHYRTGSLGESGT